MRELSQEIVLSHERVGGLCWTQDVETDERCTDAVVAAVVVAVGVDGGVGTDAGGGCPRLYGFLVLCIGFSLFVLLEV